MERTTSRGLIGDKLSIYLVSLTHFHPCFQPFALLWMLAHIAGNGRKVAFPWNNITGQNCVRGLVALTIDLFNKLHR